MKIALLIYGTLDTISGGYLYDRQLVTHLQNCGDEVTIISLPWSNYGRHLSHNLSRQLYHQLRHTPFDILLQDELNHPSLFWLNRRLRPHINSPIVSIVHHLRTSEQHPAWQQWLYRHIERLYLQTADAFITNSHTTHHTISQLLNVIPMSAEESLWARNVTGIPPRRQACPEQGQRVGMTGNQPTLVAYPAGSRFNLTISPEAISQRAYQPGPLRLLFIGNLIPRKGLHHLLTAVAQLPANSAHLHIVGSTAVAPRYTQAIQRQISQHNLQSAVTLHGPLPDSQLAGLMQYSHLLVVPSTYEGFGIVYLEGMAAGLPAIATTAGAAHEIIRHGENGYLIDVGDTTTLSHHLHHLHHNRGHLSHLSHNALAHFQAHPTWTESMNNIRQFVLKI